MTMEQFVQYIVTPAGLGVVTTIVMQILQRWAPELKDDFAFIASVLLAALFGLLGYCFLPWMAALDPAIAKVVWPVLTWAANYVLHRFFTNH